MATTDVFKCANSTKCKYLKLVASSSFFEIYSRRVFDLLNNKEKLRVFQDGRQQVQVVGFTEKVVTNVDEVIKLIRKGNQARTSGQTSVNSNSLHSHAIFQIILRSNVSMSKIHRKFSLVDLAGYERGVDTSADRKKVRLYLSLFI